MALAVPKKEKHANLTKSHLRAPRMEKQIASRLGAKRVAGSGSGAEKGDVRRKGILRIECKTTLRKSFAVTREMIEKIEQAALSCNEMPAIVIEFLSEDGKPSHTCCVMPLYALDDFVEKATRVVIEEPESSHTATIIDIGAQHAP